MNNKQTETFDCLFLFMNNKHSNKQTVIVYAPPWMERARSQAILEEGGKAA
jgi:hypothetical protein